MKEINSKGENELTILKNMFKGDEKDTELTHIADSLRMMIHNVENALSVNETKYRMIVNDLESMLEGNIKEEGKFTNYVIINAKVNIQTLPITIQAQKDVLDVLREELECADAVLTDNKQHRAEFDPTLEHDNGNFVGFPF